MSRGDGAGIGNSIGLLAPIGGQQEDELEHVEGVLADERDRRAGGSHGERASDVLETGRDLHGVGHEIL
jgi:hypothetical protein